MLEKRLEEERSGKRIGTEKDNIEILQPKLMRDKFVGSLTFIHIYSGKLKPFGVNLYEAVWCKSVLGGLEGGGGGKKEYNILGQKNFGTKESTTSRHEIFVEHKRSISSLEATKESQEKDVKERPNVEISSERNRRKKKLTESENDGHETKIVEKNQFKPPRSKNLKEVELKPLEVVMLENNVSTEYEKAKTMQCEMSDIYSDRIISETARQESRRQDEIVINGNHKSDETFQTGILYFNKMADIVSTNVTTTPAALAITGTAAADQLTRTENLEETKTVPFEDITSDSAAFEGYGAIISREPTSKE
ncbi:unnamed protein product, partial [Onchocerca flexuosa]|uniref:Uncharacterized protein n=1 Tax=Onchocerca flexuosa TaxID=387005 RepID=A0A183H2N8_9BILA